MLKLYNIITQSLGSVKNVSAVRQLATSGIQYNTNIVDIGVNTVFGFSALWYVGETRVSKLAKQH